MNNIKTGTNSKPIPGKDYVDILIPQSANEPSSTLRIDKTNPHFKQYNLIYGPDRYNLRK